MLKTSPPPGLWADAVDEELPLGSHTRRLQLPFLTKIYLMPLKTQVWCVGEGRVYVKPQSSCDYIDYIHKDSSCSQAAQELARKYPRCEQILQDSILTVSRVPQNCHQLIH